MKRLLFPAFTRVAVEAQVEVLGCFKHKAIDVEVVQHPQYPHLIEVWEPIPTNAPNPSITQPYCCYANTVIFYLRPYVIRPWHHYWICNGKRRAEKPGTTFEKWDEVETVLVINSVIKHQGQRYRCYNGRVVWSRKRWWMKRDARLERNG